MLWLAATPSFACQRETDHAIQRVGVRAGNEFSKQSREDDDAMKRNGTPASGLPVRRKIWNSAKTMNM